MISNFRLSISTGRFLMISGARIQCSLGAESPTYTLSLRLIGIHYPPPTRIYFYVLIDFPRTLSIVYSTSTAYFHYAFQQIFFRRVESCENLKLEKLYCCKYQQTKSSRKASTPTECLNLSCSQRFYYVFYALMDGFFYSICFHKFSI